MQVDVLAIGAHPDDVELTCSGTLLRLKKLGQRIGVVDCTKGEMGTRGNAGQRNREAKAAAKVLGLAYRKNLGLPDGKLAATDTAIKKLVREFRRTKPRLILSPYAVDHHPDHTACHNIVKQAFWQSRVKKYLPQLPPFRPELLIYYTGRKLVTPIFVVDISAVYRQRLAAAQCYHSQLHQPKEKQKR